MDAYRTLGEVQDFYFSDRTIYLNRVNGMLAQALASNFFRTRVEFAERHNRWLVFPNHTGEFSLASISTPNWPPSEFEPEILALWGGNGEEEGGGSVAVVIPSLTPGAGWQGPTLQPEGSGFASDLGWDAKPVARWNVVPYQDVNEPFQLGVVAFHMNGIDRVEFSVDNGPWEVVHNADRNPRTGTEEYSVILDPAKFAQDGRVEVRAIVYPDGAGIPRVLAGPVAFQGAEQGYNAPDLDEYGYPTNALWTGEHSLELFVNPNGTLVEQVVELDAGVYVWGQPPLTAPVGASSGPGVQVDRDRWITFRAKPGLNREDVVISGTVTTRPWTAPDGSRWTVDYSRVKFEGLTILSGDLNTAGTPRLPRYLSRAMLWLENSHLKGEGQFKNTGSMHVAHGFYTNSTISDTRTAIGSDSIYSSGNFVRGCELLNIGEKGIRSGYFVANTKIDGVFRGPQTSWHSSAISNPISYENRIYFDLDILDAIQAFAFRSESWNLYRHRDVALVDVHATHGGDMNNYLMFLGGTVENMIVRDSSFSSSGSGFTWSYRMNLPPDDPRFFRPHTLVYESVIWNGSANAIPGPFPLEGIYVR